MDQAIGEAAFQPPTYQRRDFVHPRHLDTIWEGKDCTECHGLEAKKIKKEKDHEILRLEEELRGILGTKVSLDAKQKRGKIVIEYYSLDDLDRILEILRKSQTETML